MQPTQIRTDVDALAVMESGLLHAAIDNANKNIISNYHLLVKNWNENNTQRPGLAGPYPVPPMIQVINEEAIKASMADRTQNVSDAITQAWFTWEPYVPPVQKIKAKPVVEPHIDPKFQQDDDGHIFAVTPGDPSAVGDSVQYNGKTFILREHGANISHRILWVEKGFAIA